MVFLEDFDPQNVWSYLAASQMYDLTWESQFVGLGIEAKMLLSIRVEKDT